MDRRRLCRPRCALGCAHWVVRLAAVALLMFTGSLAFWLYVIAWVAIAPKASRWSELPEEEVEVEMEYDEDRHTYRRKTVFRYTDAPAERVRKAKERWPRRPVALSHGALRDVPPV